MSVEALKPNKLREDLAIVGIGCRFPGGVDSPDTYWDMLLAGTDAITEVPNDRWNPNKFYDNDEQRPGKSKVKVGGYLDQKIDEFDPLFFGISPREAACIDPQQRLLMEVLWEAFEDAGIPEKSFRGSNTSVFVGAFNLDNLLHHLGKDGVELISASTAAGTTMTMLSNRLSYVFDLHGPSLTIDTACSSSLVATHYACQSIWNNESDMAVAAGVNVIMRPEYMVSMSKGGFLSKHGRCKTFDSDAGGYVRGEGAGVVLIKPLKSAIENGDNIYSVIKGTGVNQDGYTQNGISFPSSKAQQQLIERVYNEAGVNPLSVGYVEAHGTGTQAGDPVEVSSLGEVFARDRSVDTPCFIGSVKSNIGHTESAAGVASLIKASLVLKHGIIPQNLHLNTLNPKVDLKDDRLRIPKEVCAWPDKLANKKLASVNSFGYGGTNGHVILEEAPTETFKHPQEVEQSAHYLLPVSAKTTSSLKELCSTYISYLNSNSCTLQNLAYTLSERKSALTNRLVVPARSVEEFKTKLEGFVEGQIPKDCFSGKASAPSTAPIAFVFTGMGPQWWAMGQQLYQDEPLFRGFLDHCDDIFYRISGWSIVDEMLKAEEHSGMSRTEIAQPANFLLQAGLVELYKYWGITPDAVVGHSVGEVASAYISGALNLNDAILVSYHRSRLQSTLAGSGSMLAVGLGEGEVQEILSLYDDVSIAAVNGLSSITLAGDTEQINELASIFEDQNIFNRVLRVEVAYHSSKMDPIKTDLLDALKGIQPVDNKLKLYSTATGSRIEGSTMNANYWWGNVRQPVHFRQAVNAMVKDGYRTFVEIGPHPVTKNFISECLEENGAEGHVISSLVRKENERNEFHKSIGNLFCVGHDVLFWQGRERLGLVNLPKQLFERSRYWVESDDSVEYRLGELAIPIEDRNHVILNTKCRTPGTSYEVELNTGYFPFLNNHKISGSIVFPGAGYIEAGLALAYTMSHSDGVSLEDLALERMLVIDPGKIQKLHVSLDESRHQFFIKSTENAGRTWSEHATGSIIKGVTTAAPKPFHRFTLENFSGWKTIESSLLYQSFDSMGLGYSGEFKGIQNVFTKDNHVVARINSRFKHDPNSNKYHVYPSVLDCAFQSLIALVAEGSTNPYVPVQIAQINHYLPIEGEVWSEGVMNEASKGEIKCDLNLYDTQGRCLVSITGLVCQEVRSNNINTDNSIDDCFYTPEWIEIEDDLQNNLNSTNLDDCLIISFEEPDKLALSICELLDHSNNSYNIIDLVGDGFMNSGSEVTEDEISRLSDYILQHTEQFQHIIYLLSNCQKLSTQSTVSQIKTSVAPLLAIAQYLSKNKTSQKEDNTVLSIISQRAESTHTGIAVDSIQHAVASMAHLLGNEIEHLTPRHIDFTELPKTINTQVLARIIVSNNLPWEDIAINSNGVFYKSFKNCELPDEGVDDEVLIPMDTWSSHITLEGALSDNEEKTVTVDSVGTDDPTTLKIESALFPTGTELADDSVPVIATLIDSATGLEQKVIALSNIKQVTNLTNDYCDSLVEIPHNCNLTDIQALTYFAWLEAYDLKSRLPLSPGNTVVLYGSPSLTTLFLVDFLNRENINIIYCLNDPSQKELLIDIPESRKVVVDGFSYTDDVKNTLKGNDIHAVIVSSVDDYSQRLATLLKPGGIILSLDKEQRRITTGREFLGCIIYYRFSRILSDGTLKHAELWTEFTKHISASQAISSFVCEALLNAVLNQEAEATKGKLALVLSNREQYVTRSVRNALPSLSKRCTYVISGGTSGLGLKVAEWLVSNGVESVALLSRSGGNPNELSNLRSLASNSSAQVTITKCDITELSAVRDAIGEISATLPPIKGVIHCAMVLDDNLASNTTINSLHRVLSPKVSGAINLHEVTKALNIERFISISSVSSIIGNIGQASYVLANAYLDSFSQWRVSQGLPATTINLGVLKEVGVVARDESLSNILESKGIYGLSNDQVLEGMSRILNSAKGTQIGLFSIDWKTWRVDAGKSATSTRFSSLVQQAESNASMAPGLRALLEEIEDDASLPNVIGEMLTSEFSNLLRISEADIENHVSINDYGIDSIMTAEFSRIMRSKYGIEISTMELLSGPSIQHLSGTISDRIKGGLQA